MFNDVASSLQEIAKSQARVADLSPDFSLPYDEAADARELEIEYNFDSSNWNLYDSGSFR